MHYIRIIFSISLICFLSNGAQSQPVNDNFASAIDVTGLLDGCSTDAAFTTVAATGDLNPGSCWNTAGGVTLYNVWFSFVATTSEINITIDVGGVKGTQQRTQIALWQSDGTTPVSCNRYINNGDDVILGSASLSPGDTYYISVDVQNAGYQGTFSMCLSSSVDYDYYEGAQDVTGLINSCSSDAAYTTVGATSDKNDGTCWNTAGGVTLYNRWFSFTAPASGRINITVDVGGSKGTQQRTQLALWESDGLTQVACNRYINNGDDVIVGATTLTPGATYYISVDVQNGGYYGTFTLCLSDAVDYDYYEGAQDVTGLINSCSSDAAYTTVGATSDKNDGTCWNTAGGVTLYNRWFSFTAPASGRINITVDVGGSKGTQQRTQLALWESDGLTQVACNRYINNGDDVIVGATTLTPGATYYISVDVQNGGYYGTFTLCLSDAVDYDYYEGAQDVTGLINSCSSDAAYTTVGATSDKNDGTCWNTAGGVTLYNRWFSFTAPASGRINITVDVGGSKGTQQRTQLALWESDGLTQVACNRYINNGDDVIVGATTLTPGATYYISVDVQNGGYYGTFTLCLSDAVDYDYYEGAQDVTGLINSCSSDAAYTTVGATSDKNDGTCWNTAGGVTLYNRWFSFTAPASGRINITVDVGGSKGTQQRTQLALWESDGLTQVACNRYINNGDDVIVGATTLTPGATYYISVDVQNGGYYGTFTLCLSDAVDYDYYEGAFEITDTNNWCSSDAQFTTIGATSDLNDASCWNTAGGVALYNRWFRFIGPASGFISITVDVGGSKGTQQRTQVAIWQANGTTQVSCNRYINNGDDVVVGAVGLTPGVVYYISVDVQNTGYYGTFTLCVDDEPDYDFYEGAYEITDLNNWCSADAQFTTIGATSDLNDASCWNTAGGVTLYNRWFKFTAVSTVATITVDIGGAKGTQQRTQLALWQSDGTTQVACNRYVANGDDVTIVAPGLTPGNDYYISVDVQNTGYYGSFTLCVNNINNTYYSFADGVWDNPGSWSATGHGGPAETIFFPVSGDLAIIQGHDITVSSPENAAEVNLVVATDNTTLTVDNSSLTIAGKVTVDNPGNDFIGEIAIQNVGSLNINDNLEFSRAGGNQLLGFTIGTGSSMTINRDLIFQSTGGTVQDNVMMLNGTAQLNVNRDIILTSTGGRLIDLQANNTSIITVSRDIVFTASAAALLRTQLNNSSNLRIGRDFVRGGTPYGTLLSAGSSTVTLLSGTYLQNLAGNAGAGGDSFTYQNLVVNNTRLTTPQVTLAGAVTLNGNLTLTSGVVSTTAVNILNLLNASASTLGSVSSYVDGPLTYEVATATPNTIRNLPLGNNGSYRPAILSVTHSDASPVIYTARHFTQSADALGYTLPGTVDKVSAVRYWTIDRSAVANLTSARVTLYYGIGSSDGVTDPPNLRVVKTNGAGTTWFDVGGTGSAAGTGTITSDPFTSFSTITLGNATGGTNPLPVELEYFNAHYNGMEVELEWATASELNNDYFTLERSIDGQEFGSLFTVTGAGTTSARNVYKAIDPEPHSGVSYYRLKQTDYDGNSSFSPIQRIETTSLIKAEILVSPNPVYHQDANLFVKGLASNALVMVALQDTMGKRINQAVYTSDPNGDGKFLLMTKNLPSGMYLIIITANGVSRYHRLVIR